MKRTILPAILAAAVALPLAAQQPDGPPRDGMPGRGPMGGDGPGMMMMMAARGPMPAASDMLLAHTGDLKLTDAQVLRLAAISRRAADRREQLHAQMEARMRRVPEGATAPPADRQQMMQAMEQEHTAAQADLRDALAVLTPDQQARAWEMMMAMHHAGMERGGPGGGMMMMHHDGPGRDGRDRRPGDGSAPRTPPPPPQR